MVQYLCRVVYSSVFVSCGVQFSICVVWCTVTSSTSYVVRCMHSFVDLIPGDNFKSYYFQVFQRRHDASIDFYRDWSAYKRGFGDFSNNFWLGI